MTANQSARISSHIPSLDAILSGGFLPGSTTLLLSEYGAGGRELIQTSLANSIRFQQLPSGKQVRYISSRVERDTLFWQMNQLFSLQDGEFQHVRFEESTSPHITSTANWLCYVDSLTRFLPRLTDDEWYSMLDEFYTLTRAQKKKPGVLLFLLAQDVLPKSREAQLKDCFDAVFSFRWIQHAEQATKNRELFIEKYDGLPFSAVPKTYHVRILQEVGFEISNLRRIQ